eukprot:3992391-Pyramimonas_sp.AAC.1
MGRRPVWRNRRSLFRPLFTQPARILGENGGQPGLVGTGDSIRPLARAEVTDETCIILTPP